MVRQALFICYVLHYTTEWGKKKQYYGITNVRPAQTKDRAVDLRLRHHLEQPLQCMKGAVASSFVIVALGRVMSKHNSLLQEAINVAMALDQDGGVRGACYSCEKLGALLRNSAAQVRRVVGRCERHAA